VKKQVVEMAARYSAAAAVKSAAQREAARLRLVDELGRLLICYEPDTDDPNGKFYRLATEQTPTGHRLQTVFGRLGGTYPEWESHYIADLRDFRAELGPSQVKSRLTGGQLDAAFGCDNEYWPTCADEYWPTPPVFDLLARAEARASRSAALLCPPIMI
jgi:hypothetical protein